MFTDYAPKDENTQKLIKDRIYHRGRLEIRKEGTWTIETSAD